MQKTKYKIQNTSVEVRRESQIKSSDLHISRPPPFFILSSPTEECSPFSQDASQQMQLSLFESQMLEMKLCSILNESILSQGGFVEKFQQFTVHLLQLLSTPDKLWDIGKSASPPVHVGPVTTRACIRSGRSSSS